LILFLSKFVNGLVIQIMVFGVQILNSKYSVFSLTSNTIAVSTI